MLVTLFQYLFFKFIQVIFLKNQKMCDCFFPFRFEPSLSAEGDVPHLRLRRGMSEETHSAHNGNYNCFIACVVSFLTTFWYRYLIIKGIRVLSCQKNISKTIKIENALFAIFSCTFQLFLYVSRCFEVDIFRRVIPTFQSPPQAFSLFTMLISRSLYVPKFCPIHCFMWGKRWKSEWAKSRLCPATKFLYCH